MVKRITNAKIACLDFSLQKVRMKLGVQIVVEDPEKLEAIRRRLDIELLSLDIRIDSCLGRRTSPKNV